MIYDTDFADAVRLAGHRKPAKLAVILRSDYPLGAIERQMIAELIEGEFQRPHGRPEFGAGHPLVVRAVSRYRELLKGGLQEKNAAATSADEFGRSASTIRAWHRLVAERENVEREALTHFRVGVRRPTKRSDAD